MGGKDYHLCLAMAGVAGTWVRQSIELARDMPLVIFSNGDETVRIKFKQDGPGGKKWIARRYCPRMRFTLAAGAGDADHLAIEMQPGLPGILDRCSGLRPESEMWQDK
jgi:hypothetical protein